jgi:hypothetical protein
MSPISIAMKQRHTGGFSTVLYALKKEAGAYRGYHWLWLGTDYSAFKKLDGTQLGVKATRTSGFSRDPYGL